MPPNLPAETRRPEREPIPDRQPEVPRPGRETLPNEERERLKTEVLKEIERSHQRERLRETPPAAAPSAPSLNKSPTLEAIEDVLAEDLEAVYFRLEPVAQRRFKQHGEQTAREIETILLDTKQRVERKMKRILQLIIDWLKLLPGVSRFFITQAAKIKTERVIAINRDDDRSNSN